MTVSALVLDIGNVLIKWTPEAYYDRKIGLDRRVAFFDAVPILEMNDRVDLGADMAQEVAALAAEYPDWAAEIQIWHDNWLEIASPAIDHTVRLMRAVRRRKIPVFALSNFGVATFALAEANYPFLEEFDARFISGHEQMMKPDPAFYALLEQETGVPPTELLFTDDRADNIAAAAARGWHTHLFEGASGLADRLVAEGLLDADEAS